MRENGDIYTAGKIFTLLPAMTAVTNLTSAPCLTCVGRGLARWSQFNNLFLLQVITIWYLVVVLVILLQKHSCAFPSFSTDALFSATAVSTPPASQTCSQSTGAGIISVFAQGFFLNELVFSVALIALIPQFLIEDINSDIACLCQYHTYVEQQDVKRPLNTLLSPSHVIAPAQKHTHNFNGKPKYTSFLFSS